ncbi:KRR1 small subunit processome component [Paragonimus skrjabini miyazakii]|uniref:KRR1 small subunit processome component n=1 Tax=Paragonimus skrjabini miyazakii TaxID=59628 RepID=A0A8S9Z1U1_9TREM|nr:KRR1 small subunit processome component [Paragonimus skrjabini miyazakii]
MVKKTKRQTLNFPEVAGWVPYQAFSSKKEVLKEDEPSTYVEVPKDWKEPEFKPEDNVHGRLFALSSYVTLFPKYREKYIKEIWPALKKVLLEYHIRAEVDLAESSMEVRTTPKTYDPFIILKARDVIRLLARSVPFEQAIRVLQDDMFADIIEINLANRETLKALELSTNCYIVIQGKTVSVIGHYEDLKQVRKIVTGCIYDNIHPAYSIKRLLIMKKLKADPTKANISWDRFLPKLTKKVLSRRRKPHKIRKKKEYTPFPPAPTPSKIDIELEKGTYFLAEAERKRIKTAAKISQSNKVSKERQAKKRAAAFVPPQETKRSKLEPT